MLFFNFSENEDIILIDYNIYTYIPKIYLVHYMLKNTSSIHEPKRHNQILINSLSRIIDSFLDVLLCYWYIKVPSAKI